MGGPATTTGSGGTAHSRERPLGEAQLVTSRRSGLVVGRKAPDRERVAGFGSDQSSVTKSSGTQAVGKRRKGQDTVSSTDKKRKEIGQRKKVSRDKVKTVSQTSSVSGGRKGRKESDDGDWAVIDKLDIPLDNQSHVQTARSCNLDTVSMELTCSLGHQSHQGTDSREVRH